MLKNLNAKIKNLYFFVCSYSVKIKKKYIFHSISVTQKIKIIAKEYKKKRYGLSSSIFIYFHLFTFAKDAEKSIITLSSLTAHALH